MKWTLFIEIIIPTERRLIEAELTDDADGIIPEGGKSVSKIGQPRVKCVCSPEVIGRELGVRLLYT